MQLKTLWAIAAFGLLGLASVPPASAAASAAPADTGGGSNQALAAQVDASGPQQLVQSAASVLLKALDAHRDEYRQDPAKLRALVNEVFLPHLDTELSARQVLGHHWNTATPDQRQRFISAFIKSMLSNYGDALLNFTANRMRVLPYRGNAASPYATIGTQVRKEDGSQVSVNYALHHTDQGWKVWDVVVEGVSYVKSFQQDFGEQIDRQGVDAVIQRLERGEAPAAIRQTTH
jgi:phospholipid transport system substrate-binding protein